LGHDKRVRFGECGKDGIGLPSRSLVRSQIIECTRRII